MASRNSPELVLSAKQNNPHSLNATAMMALQKTTGNCLSDSRGDQCRDIKTSQTPLRQAE